jgi:hypothetical protein
MSAALLLGIASCAPRMSEASFDSPDPGSRIYAIANSSALVDKEALPELVRSLDSDDPAERMFAFLELRRRTGEDLGYSPYDDTASRRYAVDTWMIWLYHERLLADPPLLFDPRRQDELAGAGRPEEAPAT